ncbi:MAG: UPF0175 family protein [Proteobacteria bacterium]|nr:UPF0175 family protein [Pseudomonadota bacterium]
MRFVVDYEIPELVAKTLQTHWNIIAEKNLEDLAVIGYKTGVLTSYQVQLMLNHDSRWETEEFLCRHQCYLHYDEEDFKRDGKVINEVLNDKK